MEAGGSLSLFFFLLIVAEGLSGLVRQADKANLLEGVKLGNPKVKVSMLQFANDTLFRCHINYQSDFIVKSIQGVMS